MTPTGVSPSPESFSWPPTVAESHASVVFFVGDRAYKLKKPVDFGFLDFSTREARHRNCHREVELNRRLAPDVYLGVVDMVEDGTVVDHLVAMRRMPHDRRLSALVTEGDGREEDYVRQIARRLASFHATADSSPAISAAATPEAVRSNWEESFEQLAPFVPDVLDAETAHQVESLVRRYLDGRRPLLERRVAEGRIRDGHGDLQADDIFCFDDGPRILDCIEFNDRFRHLDVLNDVAFLAMDLERLGAPELGARLLRDYLEFSGESCPTSLVEHYVAYRAHVRCKVNCLRATQASGPEHEDAVTEARRLLNMAHRYLESARVRLVLVGGLPGTGKSTLASSLGAETGWTVLRSDELRKEMAGVDTRTPQPVGYGEGIYTPAAKRAVYDELLSRAVLELAAGESVVLDASWSTAADRERARSMAEEHVADLDEIRCEAPEALAVERMRLRSTAGTDVSDATPEVARLMAADADPWPEAASVQTTGTPAESLHEALLLLGRAGYHPPEVVG